MQLISRDKHSTQQNSTPIYWQDVRLILYIALFIRLLWVWLTPQIDPFIAQNPLHGDAASYDRLARSLLNGTGFAEYPPQLAAFWPPLYPIFLSLVYRGIGYFPEVIRYIQAAFGVVVPMTIYLIGQKAIDRQVALLTGLGLAVYPYLVYFGSWLIAEAFFMALFGLALWLTCQIPQRQSAWWLVGAGLVYGLSALAKPTVLFFMPFIAIWLFFAPKEFTLWKRLGYTAVLTITTLAAILPWTYRNYQLYDQTVLISTNGGYTFLGANNAKAWGGHDEGYPPAIDGLNDAEMEDAYYAEAFAWIRSDVAGFVRLLVPKYQRLLSPLSVASFRQDFPVPFAPIIYTSYYLFLFTSLVGGFLAIRHWREIGFLYAPILGVIISAGLYYGDARYTIPMVPSLVFFTALTLTKMWQFYQGRATV